MRFDMRAVVQRVSAALVTANEQAVGNIEKGLLVYLGVGQGDSEQDVPYMADKLAGLRIFADAAGKMNLSVRDVEGAILLISNFTLYGDCRTGRRPGFIQAADPSEAESLYEAVADALRGQGIPVEQGRFGAMMQVTSVNVGPGTFLLDSAKIL
jgi:D-tyrosyl-tRNA(Tyr) deacylase